MQNNPSQRPKQGRKQKPEWPKEVRPGRAIVRVYKRLTPSKTAGYMVANYQENGARKFESFNDLDKAVERAEQLAKLIDKRDFLTASMTKEQSLEYFNSVERLKPFNVTVDAATAVIVESLKLVGDLGKVFEAARFYALRHRPVTAKSVADVVTELLKVKESRGASDRYKVDLESRLGRFARECNKTCCNISSSDVQAWLDGLRDGDSKPLSPQSYKNYRTTLHTFFAFAVARGYAVDNVVERVEKLKVRNGDVEIFTPAEITRLLATAQEHFPQYLPCIAIGAFAGLRSAEIERLEWSDIDLKARHIVVAASKSKTASRRIVPIHDNLYAWLSTFANAQGQVWKGKHFEFYDTQYAVAKATAVAADEQQGVKAQKPVEWKQNGLRHSYASYRFAQTGDAGRVAGECGNSASVIHRHYRELCKPAQATAWFAVAPAVADNVVSLAAVSAPTPQ